MPPTAETLLQAWETGASAGLLDRSPTLLHSLGALTTGEPLAALTVGQCDALLFGLRRRMFGEQLEAVATCPACQTGVELTVPLAELQPPLPGGPVPPLEAELDGFTIRCRIPRNDDLSALAARGDQATLRELVAGCLVEATANEGVPVTPDELPDTTVEAIAAAVAERDPGAHVELGVRCPCGHEWVDALDIREVIWSDLTEWVQRTLLEVHQLARAYGWAEHDILAMGSWRRRWYLEATGW